jgi:hypothetical protein
MDSLTETGSKLLMTKIVSYWEERGHSIEVWREYSPHESKGRAGMYFVRSNLLNGLPRCFALQNYSLKAN